MWKISVVIVTVKQTMISISLPRLLEASEDRSELLILLTPFWEWMYSFIVNLFCTKCLYGVKWMFLFLLFPQNVRPLSTRQADKPQPPWTDLIIKTIYEIFPHCLRDVQYLSKSKAPSKYYLLHVVPACSPLFVCSYFSRCSSPTEIMCHNSLKQCNIWLIWSAWKINPSLTEQQPLSGGVLSLLCLSGISVPVKQHLQFRERVLS